MGLSRIGEDLFVWFALYQPDQKGHIKIFDRCKRNTILILKEHNLKEPNLDPKWNIVKYLMCYMVWYVDGRESLTTSPLYQKHGALWIWQRMRKYYLLVQSETQTATHVDRPTHRQIHTQPEEAMA